MSSNLAGLKEKPTYENLVNYIQNDKDKLNYPDRRATFLRNSFYLTQLDGVTLEDRYKQDILKRQLMETDNLVAEIARDSNATKTQIQQALQAQGLSPMRESTAIELNIPPQARMSMMDFLRNLRARMLGGTRTPQPATPQEPLEQEEDEYGFESPPPALPLMRDISTPRGPAQSLQELSARNIVFVPQSFLPSHQLVPQQFNPVVNPGPNPFTGLRMPIYAGVEFSPPRTQGAMRGDLGLGQHEPLQGRMITPIGTPERRPLQGQGSPTLSEQLGEVMGDFQPPIAPPIQQALSVDLSQHIRPLYRTLYFPSYNDPRLADLGESTMSLQDIATMIDEDISTYGGKGRGAHITSIIDKMQQEIEDMTTEFFNLDIAERQSQQHQYRQRVRELQQKLDAYYSIVKTYQLDLSDKSPDFNITAKKFLERIQAQRQPRTQQSQSSSSSSRGPISTTPFVPVAKPKAKPKSKSRPHDLITGE